MTLPQISITNAINTSTEINQYKISNNAKSYINKSHFTNERKKLELKIIPTLYN